MIKHKRSLMAMGLGLAVGLPLSGLSGLALAQNPELPAAQLAALKQKLAQRLPQLPPIDGARQTSMPGVIEVRSGGNIFYTDANGDHLIDGQMIDTRSQRNLTEERLEVLNRVDFATLPLNDAVLWKRGNGKRRMVVFSDPNCGYCKRLERDIQKLNDVSVYTIMIGILGDDSRAKSEAIWCAKDRTQAWLGWMLDGVQPPKALGQCGSPLQRNMALAQKLRVNGTPAIIFEDGTRAPGAVPLATLEQRLARATGKAD